MLLKFRITPDSYHIKFRNLKQHDNISHEAFMHIMCDSIKQLITGKGTEEDYGKLFDLFAHEHFFNGYSGESRAAI